MDYEEFRAEWQKAMDAAGSFSLSDAMSAEVDRLKGLAASFADPDDRDDAGEMIATLEDVLSYEREPMSEEMRRPIGYARESTSSAVRQLSGLPAPKLRWRRSAGCLKGLHRTSKGRSSSSTSFLPC
jgi:hypothetical protein